MLDKIIVNSKEYNVLFSFESKNTNKKYIVYTDYKKENNSITCYGSIYEDGKILPIDTDAENEAIEEMLKTMESISKEKYALIKE